MAPASLGTQLPVEVRKRRYIRNEIVIRLTQFRETRPRWRNSTSLINAAS